MARRRWTSTIHPASKPAQLAGHFDEFDPSRPYEDPLPWDDGYDDDPGGWLDRNPDPGPPPVSRDAAWEAMRECRQAAAKRAETAKSDVESAVPK